MGKVKIGYLPLYIKLYDDSNPGYRAPLMAYMRTLVSMLEGEGLEVVTADVCRVKAEFEAAVKTFRDSGVDCVVTQHLAYSPSLEALEALLGLDVEIIVLDTTPDYELAGVAGYEGRISANHGIHGVQDMCSMLRRNGKPYQLCVGHAMHSEVIAETAAMCRAAAAAKAYRNARVGLVGGVFEGMGDFQVTDEAYKSKIGAEVLRLPREEAEKRLAAVTDEAVRAEMAEDSRRFTVEATNQEAYAQATRTGLALRGWMEDEKLTAISVNFLTMDISGLPKMPFLECSKAMVRGLGYAGEGDVLTAGLVGALRSVYPETTFTEIFCPDWKADLLLLSHMGEANLSLAQWRPVLADTPFTYNSCGDTVAAYMCLRPGKAVLVNLAPMGDAFSLVLSEVELVDAGLEHGAYRYAMQGWMKPGTPLREYLKAYSLAGGTHHSALVYGADIGGMKAFGQMMGFDVTVV